MSLQHSVNTTLAHAARQRRRGTVLVIILGALALISVITIAYVTVGQTDRRSAAVAVRKDNVDATINTIRDYIAQEVANEALATSVDGYTGEPANPTPQLVRRHATFGYVDPFRRSTLAEPGQAVSAASRVRRFSPSGSYSDAFRLAPGTAIEFDPRIPGAPLLASTTPSWLRAGKLSSQAANRGYLFQRDWKQISVLAPDGRFVNLWNLAPVINNGGALTRASGFDARSPIPVNANLLADASVQQNMRPTLLASGAVESYLSFGLTMASPDLGDAPTTTNPGLGAIQPSVDASYAPLQVKRYEPGVGPAATLTADPNIPAHWSMYQLNMVRPMRDTQFGPDRPEYLPYQWADTDGDGFPDSRWFELVDASDPANILSLLPRDERFRWFVAARVVDLSGLVNLNTATEFRRPPWPLLAATGTPVDPAWVTAQRSKAGSSPADIDFRRLLTFDDVYASYGSATGAGLGLAEIPQPPVGSNDPANDYSTVDRPAARRMGDAAFSALLEGRKLAKSSTPPQAGTDLTPGQPAAPVPLAADQRWLSFQRRSDTRGAFVGQSFVGGSPPATTTAIVSGGGFGPDDQIELLTFRGQNDPSVTTRLERTLDGRGTTADRSRGPLRSSRGPTYESLVDSGGVSGLGDGEVDEATLARSAFDVRQYLTAFNGSRLLRAGPIPADVQSRMSPITDAKIDANDAIAMFTRASTLGGTPFTAANNAESDRLFASWDLLFQGYADALLPYSGTPGAWGISYPYEAAPINTTGLSFDPAIASARVRTATLHYGGNRGPFTRWGPELALRLSAHLTANMADATSSPLTPPRAFTLLIDRFYQPAVYDGVAVPGISADQARFAYPWAKTQFPVSNVGTPRLVRPGLLDLDRTLPAGERNRLALSDGSGNPTSELTTAGAGAITVFGIKPQPFLTNVTTMVIYRDSIPPASATPAPTSIVIDTNIRAGSGTAEGLAGDDVVAQIIAFQLHNPFDTTIFLSNPTNATVTSASWTDFYLEFNNYLFKLAAASTADGVSEGAALSLAPGQTRVFYALNRPRADVELALTTAGIPGSGDRLASFVAGQFTNSSTTGITLTPIQIPLMVGQSATASPTSWSGDTRTITTSSAVDFLADVTPDASIYPSAVTSARLKKEVYLWRALGTPAPTGAATSPGGGLFDASNTGVLSRAANLRYNDQLVDVLADPTPATAFPVLDCRLEQSATYSVTIGNYDPSTSSVAFVLRSSISRRGDPRTDGGPGAPGTARGYLYSSKFGWFQPTASALAVAERFPSVTGQYDTGNCVVDLPATPGAGDFGRRTFTELFGAMSAVGTTDLKIPAARERPDLRTISDIATTANLDGRTINQVRAEFYRWRGNVALADPANSTSDFGGSPIAPSATGGAPQIPSIPTLRTADLMAVLAIGPEYDPSNTPAGIGSAPGGDTRPDTDGFITLSQALAMAANYISPPDATAAAGVTVLPLPANFSVYARLGATDGAPVPAAPPATVPATRPAAQALAGPAGALDRGYLVLDRFAPFEDRAAAVAPIGPASVVGVFNASGAAQDAKRWPGIPLALNIFNVFDTRVSQENALTTLTPGLVNLNTAPVPVLRLVPLLSPTTEPGVWGPWGTAATNWLTLALGPNTTGKTTTPLPTADTDVAPAVLAYRDRQIALDRGVQTTLAANTAPTPRAINFSDTDVASVPPLNTVVNYDGPAGWDGRRLTTHVDALREAPGFASEGELMMLINRQKRPGLVGFTTPPSYSVDNPTGVAPATAAPAIATPRLPASAQIDALGVESASLPIGTSPGQTQNPNFAAGAPTSVISGSLGTALGTRQVPTGPNVLATINEPDSWTERLLVAAAAMGTTTTRSDVFAVWFVVHGYTRADTENLRLNDPLTPSVARRFVMVLDRSNVTQMGQKPKIVLFQEVPMTQK